MDDEDRARELAVYLNITTQRWRETQYEPISMELIEAAVGYLVKNQDAAA